MKFLVAIFSKNLQRIDVFKNIFNMYSANFEIYIIDTDSCSMVKYKEYNLILVDTDSSVADKVYEFYSSLNQMSKVIVFGEIDQKIRSYPCEIIEVSKKLKLIPVLNILNEFFNKNYPDLLNQKNADEYIAIKITKLLSIPKLPCDAFLKLNEKKFIKCLNENDIHFHDVLIKYQAKSFQYVYLKSDDYYSSFDAIFENIIPPADEFSAVSKEQYYSNSQNVIFELMGEIGISENVLQVSEELVQDICKEYQKSEFAQLFEKFKYSKDRYIFDHSTMTSMFAISLCGRFEWKNEEIYRKLTMAALYHDFGFANPKLAIIEQDKEEINKLTKSFRREVLDHPEVMATKLSNLKGAPSEVIYMVQRHHEIHEDCGYKKMVSSAYLSVLECIFITAHEFTNQIYKIAFRPDKMHLAIERTLAILNNGNFKQVRAPFLEMVKKDYLEAGKK